NGLALAHGAHLRAQWASRRSTSLVRRSTACPARSRVGASDRRGRLRRRPHGAPPRRSGRPRPIHRVHRISPRTIHTSGHGAVARTSRRTRKTSWCRPMTEHQSNPLVLRQPDRSALVAVNRTELRLWCWGDETAAPVLLLHGAYDHGRLFDDLAPRVAALGYHAVALDFRGHGDSGPLDSGFAWALLHIDLALLVPDILAAAVAVIAHSFGAGQAIGLAGAFPELVRWLVVMDGLGPPPFALSPPDDIRDAIRTNAARTDRILFDRHRREWPSVEDMAAY